MHNTIISIAALFALSAIAAPTDPARKPDACGPTTQQPTDPKDTCKTTPTSDGDTTGFTIGLTESRFLQNFDWTICNPLVETICDTMASATPDAWHFNTSQVALDYGSPACNMGFWVPSDPAAATKVSGEQCRNIFSSMVKAAAGERDATGASINLKQNPAGQDGQFELPDGSGTGEAVNRLYPSYTLAVQA